ISGSLFPLPSTFCEFGGCAVVEPIRNDLDTGNPRSKSNQKLFSWFPGFLINSVHNAMRGNRMAEIASPASDPRSLRRHYPDQVQGVSSTFCRTVPGLSAIAASPHTLSRSH